jgi:hypothetical protein
MISVILYAVIGRSDTAIKNRWRSLKRFPLYSQNYLDSHSLTWCSSLAASGNTIADCSTSVQQIGESISGKSAERVIDCQVKGNVKQQ